MIDLAYGLTFGLLGRVHNLEIKNRTIVTDIIAIPTFWVGEILALR